MITGRVTSDREAIIALEVRALEGRPETVDAVIDTGFTEFLALPLATIRRLRLPYRGSQHATLANGEETELAMHRAIVEWHGHPRPVSVFAVQGGPLLGMAMLHGNRLTMDVLEDGPLQIEPIRGEPDGS